MLLGLEPIVQVRSLVRGHVIRDLSAGLLKFVRPMGIVTHVALVAVGVSLEEFTK